MDHERACASKTLCFSSSTYSLFFFFLYSPVSLLLVSFILSSHSIWCFLSFPVAAAVSASGPSMGAVLAAQQSLRTCTQTWYTLYSINSELCKHFPTRTRNSHTWSCADRSHTNLHPDGLSSTSQWVYDRSAPSQTLPTTYSSSHSSCCVWSSSLIPHH